MRRMLLLVVMETLICVILSNTSSNISHHEVEYEQQFLYANYYLVILKDFGVIRKVYILNGQPSYITKHSVQDSYKERIICSPFRNVSQLELGIEFKDLIQHNPYIVQLVQCMSNYKVYGIIAVKAVNYRSSLFLSRTLRRNPL